MRKTSPTLRSRLHVPATPVCRLPRQLSGRAGNIGASTNQVCEPLRNMGPSAKPSSRARGKKRGGPNPIGLWLRIPATQREDLDAPGYRVSKLPTMHGQEVLKDL